MTVGGIRKAALAAAGTAALAVSAPLSAGDYSRPDFNFGADGDTSIVVFRPDVHVGSLSVGGVDEPNAEWTQSARENIQSALIEAASRQNAQLTFLDELEGENAQVLNTYRALFETVAGSMAVHLAGGDTLPTKEVEVVSGRSGRSRTEMQLDWTLGEGARQLKAETGADYAMFVYTYDSYGDGGRKAAQVAGMLGCIIGACVVISAGVHIGYSGLVDLETGDVVWFNTDASIGGDPREPDGAVTRVGKLMDGFPQPVAVEQVAVEQVAGAE